MHIAALDASGDLEFIAVVYGSQQELETLRERLTKISPLHMREIGKARRLKLAESFLRLLEGRSKHIRVLCIYTGIHKLRKSLKTRRIPSSKLELELKKATALAISSLLRKIFIEIIEADTEVKEILKMIGLSCRAGPLVGLADIAAWINRRYYGKRVKPYAKLFIEKNLSLEIEKLARNRLKKY